MPRHGCVQPGVADDVPALHQVHGAHHAAVDGRQRVVPELPDLGLFGRAQSARPAARRLDLGVRQLLRQERRCIGISTALSKTQQRLQAGSADS